MLFKNPPLLEVGWRGRPVPVAAAQTLEPPCLALPGVLGEPRVPPNGASPKSKAGLDTGWGPTGSPTAGEACRVLAMGWGWLSLSLGVPQSPHGVAWGQFSACPICERGAGG